jgi:hypothetical protein
MNSSDIPRRGLSPLWVIALFLSFSETVLGMAVMNTSGGIQIALTSFVIAFPTIVGGLFFLILWKKPYVFYPPAEFGKSVDVKTYVEAMQMTRIPPSAVPISEAAIRSIEAKMTTLSSVIEATRDPKEQADLLLQGAVEAVKESVISIDSRPMFGRNGRVWEETFDPQMAMRDFLDSLYFEMHPWGIEPFTYGKKWAIRNPRNNEVLLAVGRDWARENGMVDDSRPIATVGLRGATTLEIVPV